MINPIDANFLNEYESFFELNLSKIINDISIEQQIQNFKSCKDCKVKSFPSSFLGFNVLIKESSIFYGKLFEEGKDNLHFYFIKNNEREIIEFIKKSDSSFFQYESENYILEIHSGASVSASKKTLWNTDIMKINNEVMKQYFHFDNITHIKKTKSNLPFGSEYENSSIMILSRKNSPDSSETYLCFKNSNLETVNYFLSKAKPFIEQLTKKNEEKETEVIFFKESINFSQENLIAFKEILKSRKIKKIIFYKITQNSKEILKTFDDKSFEIEIIS